MFDECWSHHVIEHFYPNQVPNILREIYRVLKPSGKVEMVLPDFLRCCEYVVKFHEQAVEWDLQFVVGHLLGRSEVPYMRHEWLWVGQDLINELEKVDFIDTGIERLRPDVNAEQQYYNMKVWGFKQ